MSTTWRTKIKRGDGRPNCNHPSDEPCTLCDEDRKRAHNRPIQAPSTWSFMVDTYEHMFHPWERPYEITSRQQLREESIKRGVVSKQLKESTIFKSDPDRWV